MNWPPLEQIGQPLSKSASPWVIWPTLRLNWGVRQAPYSNSSDHCTLFPLFDNWTDNDLGSRCTSGQGIPAHLPYAHSPGTHPSHTYHANVCQLNLSPHNSPFSCLCNTGRLLVCRISGPTGMVCVLSFSPFFQVLTSFTTSPYLPSYHLQLIKADLCAVN